MNETPKSVRNTKKIMEAIDKISDTTTCLFIMLPNVKVKDFLTHLLTNSHENNDQILNVLLLKQSPVHLQPYSVKSVGRLLCKKFV